MKFRFELVYRLGLLLLLVTMFWAVWANAQPAGVTNPPPVAPTVTGTNLSVTSTNQFQALTFGLNNFDFLREHTMLTQPLWKYLASLIYIVLAFCVAWLLDFIVSVWLHRLAAKTETKYDDLLLKLLRGPIKVVAFVILLNIGLGVFDWPARAQLLLARGLIVIVACSVTYLAVNVVDLLLGWWREKMVYVSTQDRVFAELLFPMFSKLAKVAIVIAAVMLTADNLEIKVTSLLAGLSVGGLALGLAAQDTVANLFGAVAIFLDKPFHLGDAIRVEGCEGSVESIGLRSTRIRNSDGYHVTIPNKMMGNAIITNITRRPTIRTEMNLGLTYDTPVEKVKRATAMLGEIYRSHPKTGDVLISFNKFADSALNIYIVHTWNGIDPKEHFAQMQEWNLQIKQRFEAENIEFAFPTHTIHVKTGAAK
jgi:MscS family membrane protein